MLRSGLGLLAIYGIATGILWWLQKDEIFAFGPCSGMSNIFVILLLAGSLISGLILTAIGFIQMIIRRFQDRKSVD